MNRIEQKFQELRKKRGKAFIAFITAGDPDLKTTEELVLAFERSGVDIVELGVPFSDPLADGPVIQAASQRALKKHVNLDQILGLVARIRRKSSLPVALMTYYNPVFHYGEERFIEKAKSCGVDGVIIPDLPPEEAQSLIKSARRNDLATIFFLAPTTSKKRMPLIVKASTGFIYYVSLKGVTGSRKVFSEENKRQITLAKKLTSKAVCVGFGVATPQQVRTMAAMSDGVIVGSAIINEITKNKGKKGLVDHVAGFVRRLVQSLP